MVSYYTYAKSWNRTTIRRPDDYAYWPVCVPETERSVTTPDFVPIRTVIPGPYATDGLLRIVLVVLAVVALAPMLMMAFAFPMMGTWGGMMGRVGGAGVSPLWGVVMMLVWSALVLGGGYLVFRRVASVAAGDRDPALRELRHAYARGDISDEEYEQRRTGLREE